MSAPKVFQVLTEFRYDIGHAVASSKTLQNETNKIASAADGALLSFQKLGLGLVAQMGLGGGGLLGAMGLALKSADKFAMAQRQIANLFLANGMFQGADSYERSMVASEIAMRKMVAAARQFSLPTSELMQFSKLVGAPLIAKGLDDSKMTKSIDLARFFLKAAPTLGVDPGLAQGQLLDAVMGRANMADTLFYRLAADSAALSPYAGTKGGKNFNALPAAQRLEILTKALEQFGNNSKIVKENAESLSSQMQRLSENISGVASVLKPIGDAVMEPIKKLLLQLNEWLEGTGAKMFQSLGNILGRLAKDPEGLLLYLMQLRELQRDIGRAGKTMGILAIIHGVSTLLNFFFGRTLFSLIGAALWGGMKMLFGGAIFMLGKLPLIMRVIGMIGYGLYWAFSRIFLPLGLLTMVFQGLSHAVAKAKVGVIKWFADNAATLADYADRFSLAMSRIMMPINYAIEGISEMFLLLVGVGDGKQFLSWTNSIIVFFETIGELVRMTMAAVSGLGGAAAQFYLALQDKDFFNMKDRIQHGFWQGFRDFMARTEEMPKVFDREAPVSQRVTNIGKVEINNQFKENLEPDRIAFTLVEQLQKAAINPTRAVGGAFRTGQLGK